MPQSSISVLDCQISVSATLCTPVLVQGNITNVSVPGGIKGNTLFDIYVSLESYWQLTIWHNPHMHYWLVWSGAQVQLTDSKWQKWQIYHCHFRNHRSLITHRLTKAEPSLLVSSYWFCQLNRQLLLDFISCTKQIKLALAPWIGVKRR